MSTTTSQQKYPAYEAYKDSGVEWLGKIPTDWKTTHLYSLANQTKQINALGKESNVLSLSYGNIVKRNIETSFGLLPASFNTYQIVQPGMIVLRLTDLQNDQKSLRTGYVNEQGIITSAYLALSFNDKINSRFAHYYLHALDVNKIFYSLGGGVRQQMDYADMKHLAVTVPELNKQKQIVDFLDQKCGQIDSLIEQKQQLIGRLKEKRQSLITQAVTKGLDPNVEMKDSGVPWIGSLPIHWNLLPVKAVLAERKEKNLPIKTTNVLSLSMEKGVFPYSEKTGGGNKAKEDLSAYRIARPGDIVVNSMNVIAGSVGLSNYFGAISPVYYPLYVKDNDNQVSFFAAVFSGSGFQKSLLGLGNGILFKKSESSGKLNTIRLRIPMQKLNAVILPVPPVEEQKAIADFVDSRSIHFTSAEDKLKEQISALREYKSALIYNAVTGKIKI